MADIKDFSIGRLSIGVSHTRGRVILPEILPAYREQFPNIDLHLIEGNSSELDNRLIHGDVDLIIGMLPFRVENVGTVPICDEEVLMAVSDRVLKRSFPGRVEEIKAQLSERADLSLLRECPFLLINKGNRVRTLADEMFEEAQITPNIVLETENIETVLALAVRGMGITFYPKMFISRQLNLQQKVNQYTSMNFYTMDYPKAHGTLAIGFHKDHYMSQAAREFIRIATEML